MSVYFLPGFGTIALVGVVMFAGLAALFFTNVKLRHVSRRWLGFSVHDFSAELQAPSPLRSRSYQIALYVTMKALPRSGDATPLSAPSASPPSASRAPRAA